MIATRFRQWANRVLKEHLLKGGSVNQRLVSHENKLENLDSRMLTLEKQVDFFVKANLPSNVKGIVYSAHVTSRLKDEAARLNREFPTVELKSMQNVHDRFIIADETVYHIGSSLNELGKKLTAFSVLNIVTKQQLLEMVK